MYDFTQHVEQQLTVRELYDDEYDEYMLWYSSLPHAVVQLSDSHQILAIPSRYRQLESPWPTPPASPLLVSYTVTPNFKFPAIEGTEPVIATSPTPRKAPKDERPKRDAFSAQRTLPTRKRSYSNFF